MSFLCSEPLNHYPKHAEENTDFLEFSDMSLLLLQPNFYPFLTSFLPHWPCQTHSCFRAFALALPFMWNALSPEPHMAHSLSSLRSLSHITLSLRSSWTSGFQLPTSSTGYFLTLHCAAFSSWF